MGRLSEARKGVTEVCGGSLLTRVALRRLSVFSKVDCSQRWEDQGLKVFNSFIHGHFEKYKK